MSTRQREEFETRGLTRFSQCVAPDVVDAFRARIVDHLAARGIPHPGPPGQAVTPSKVNAVTKQESFRGVWGDDVAAIIDAFLGKGRWHEPGHAGQFLSITSPDPESRWRLPHNVWHLDYQARPNATQIPGLQLFLYLDQVSPRGGGTRVIEGSQRLVDRFRSGVSQDGRSADLRKKLRRAVPWVEALCTLREGEDRVARFMGQAEEFEGVSLRVSEMTGEPGDVVVMHPWMFHSLSLNCGERPRMVLTERIRRNTPPPG